MALKSIVLNTRQFVFLILLIESILVFLLAPQTYSYWFNLFCMIQYIVVTIGYITVQKKTNYFDFDVIFLLTYYFIMFFFPVFMYGKDIETLFFAFAYDYNEDVISRASALSLLGAQAYMFGNTLVNEKKYINKQHHSPIKTTIPTGVMTIGVVICFMLFIIAAGPELLTHKYDGSLGGDLASPAMSYVLVLLSSLLFATLVIEILNWSIDKLYKKNTILLAVSLTITAIFLMIGSRTTPLQIVLLVIGLYALKVRPIGLKLMILLIIIGSVALAVVGLARIGDSQASQSLSGGNGALMLIQDLVLNNRNTFMAIDLVDKNGLTWGVSMLTPILGILPFMNTMFISTTGVSSIDMSSAYIITSVSLGTTSDFDVGFGTNIIADIYMSFGMVGVILMMCFLGYIVKRSILKSIWENNIYYTLLYGILISYAVFIVRAEFFVFLRYFIWGAAIINVFNLYRYNISILGSRNKIK